MKVIRSILSSPWMLEASTMQSYLPIAARILRGESVQVYDEKPRGVHFASPRIAASSPKSMDDLYDDEEMLMAPEPGSIAIYPVTGLITKYDQMCGPMGTVTLMEMMRKWDNDERIIGHLMEIDSGGGEATNIESVARFIRQELKKPVLAWVNGTAASAAYYMAAAADEIYASQSTDMFGSIGVVLSFADVKPSLEKEGVVFHEIYADQSDLKNLDFREALEGKYDKIKQTILNPFAVQFISTIQEFRPQITREDVFRGEIMTAPDALEYGLIDGIGLTKAQIIQLMFTRKMHFEMINTISSLSQILGYELQTHEGGVFLNMEELSKLKGHIVAEATQVEVPDIEAINETLNLLQQKQADFQASIEAIRAQNTQVESQLTALSDKFEAFSKAPAAQPAQVFSASDPASGGAKPADALDAFEQTLLQVRNQGQTLAFVK
jgi:protease-4